MGWVDTSGFRLCGCPNHHYCGKNRRTVGGPIVRVMPNLHQRGGGLLRSGRLRGCFSATFRFFCQILGSSVKFCQQAPITI